MEIVIPQNPIGFGGHFRFLDITKQAAITYGNTATVIDTFPCAEIDEFRKHYRHRCPNPPWCGQWSFEQWIILAKWMRQNNREMVFKIDSDCLVFEDLQRFWNDQGRPTFSSPVYTPFVSVEVAEFISNYILQTFRDGKELERCFNPENVCDYTLIAPAFNRYSCRTLDDADAFSAVDTNLFVLANGPQYEGHKDIWFVQGQPCLVRPLGFTRLVLLHCWGAAKAKMDVIWAQSRASIGAAPVRLSIA